MISFVEKGGKFTFDARLAQSILAETRQGIPPPIHISIMDDGRYLLHDGHHRAVALFLGGRKYINYDEYEVGQYTYSDYLEPNPQRGWFTPFDVVNEVRLPGFWAFKRTAQHVHDKYGQQALTEFIKLNKQFYVEPRQITTVGQLAELYQRRYYGRSL